VTQSWLTLSSFHPVLLGAINASSGKKNPIGFVKTACMCANSIRGNKPPWTLKAKANYGFYDARRAAARAGKSSISPPKDLMPMAMTVLPLRALHFIKRNYPRQVYEKTWHYLFSCFWTAPNMNVSKLDVFVAALGAMPADFAGELEASRHAPKRMFSPQEV
jgi:glutathione S-transferase kappa 1